MAINKELEALFSSYQKLLAKPEVSSLIMKRPKEWEGKTSTLIVTDDCNLRCTYCYITHKTKNAMTWEVAKEFIDLVFEKHMHFKDIPIEEQTQFEHGKIWDFVGGEPFLEYKLVFKCMHYIMKETEKLPNNHPWKRGFECSACREKGNPAHIVPGFRFQFSSNGTLFNNPEIRKELESFGSGYVSLAITVDGPEDMHDHCRVYEDGVTGSFEIIMENWAWYKKNFPEGASTTKSTISHENLTHINKVATFFWEELDIPYVSMNCVFENVWYRGDQLILFDQLCDLADYLIIDKRYQKFGIRWFDPMLGTKDTSDTKWCGAGTAMDACGWDGNIYPCLRFKTLDNQKPVVLGDIKTWKNQEIIDSFAVGNCHNEGNQQLETTGVNCKECLISGFCSSCQAYSYDVYGRLDVKAIFNCPMHKANVLANLYFFGRLLGIAEKQDRDYFLMLLDDFTKDDYFGYDENGKPVPVPFPSLNKN